MKKLSKYLQDYLNNTPKEVLMKEFEELEYLNQCNADVDEYFDLRSQTDDY